MASQVRHHGYDPAEAIVEVAPRPGEHAIRDEDILEAIDRHADTLALVFWGGVNYYTGQVFDMAAITEAAHRVGARAGFDLAHAAGNIPLSLHDWDVDFAAWCHYKYLNGGPGAVAGAFIHERHHADADMHRLDGWWGNEPSSRFRMEKVHQPYRSAEAWQVSTPSPILYACLQASLDIFEEAGWERVRKKAATLSDWLHFLLDDLTRRLPGRGIECITPPVSKGCQASLLTGPQGRALFDHLSADGFFTDWREPDVIRLAPVPLYNTYSEVWRFHQSILRFFAE
jgi:kynureninase